MIIALASLYGLFAFIAVVNLLLMRRPKPGEGPPLAVLIPARNEAENLRRLLPALQRRPDDRLFVFDDESTDGTGEIAAAQGATVVRPAEPLPEGWTGKNRACHELGKAAHAAGVRWWVYLDADVYPEPTFLDAMRREAAERGERTPVMTGFPHIRPGRGIEPLFLAWVGWILLASNPFGLVACTGKGHNRFLNGQVQLWRADVYTRLWPNERLKHRVMEDVQIGRMLAREGVAVETLNLSRVLGVKMYETWRETLDGMSKNSFEITGSAWGSILLALLFIALGWAWVLVPWTFGLLALSGLAVALTARAPLWPLLLMPIALTIGAFTVLRSLYWRKTGQTRWKGRVYRV